MGDIAITDQDCPAIGHPETHQDAPHRRLSGGRGAQEYNKAARVD